MVNPIPTNNQYILNHCTKYLARHVQDLRHNYVTNASLDWLEQPWLDICEAWRFPIIDSWNELPRDEKEKGKDSTEVNRVTFVYVHPGSAEIFVTGSFSDHPIQLDQLTFDQNKLPYYAKTVLLPTNQVYTYHFIVEGVVRLDPINPQRQRLANGQNWSRFFTNYCTEPLSFEPLERDLLLALAVHILPFRTWAAQRLLSRVETREWPGIPTQRLDQEIGVVNFIDKLLAKEEHFLLQDYKLCLNQIRRALLLKYPGRDPATLPVEVYEILYDFMAVTPDAQHYNGQSFQWDFGVYGSPQYFLQILRRHVYTGAFSHPKYGGNTFSQFNNGRESVAGWDYLDEISPLKSHPSYWKAAIEKPLGQNQEYLG